MSRLEIVYQMEKLFSEFFNSGTEQKNFKQNSFCLARKKAQTSTIIYHVLD